MKGTGKKEFILEELRRIGCAWIVCIGAEVEFDIAL